MKHIVLLRDDRPFWGDVASWLRGANAKLSSFGAEWEPEHVISFSPDMIVTNLRNLTDLKISLRRIPKIAIQADAQEAHHVPTSRLEWNLEIVKWPTGKEEFLLVTSRQLAICPRKHFACIFRVFPGGDGSVAMAQTMNLSLTGLAFKAIADFEIGQLCRIVLELPGEKDGFEVQARIVRCHDQVAGDPRTAYGAEYVDPPEGFKRSLKKFIHVY